MTRASRTIRSSDLGSDLTAGHAVTYLPPADEEARRVRDNRARRNLALTALQQPDPQAWLLDMLQALGLDNPNGDREIQTPRCGTEAGWSLHRRRREWPCRICRTWRDGQRAARLHDK